MGDITALIPEDEVDIMILEGKSTRDSLYAILIVSSLP
jgi:hypothetical protein